MNHNIQVTISGPAGSGKSIVSALITAVLRSMGVTVIYEDDDVKDEVDDVLAYSMRIHTIAPRLTAKVVTQRTTRESGYGEMQ